MTTNKISWPN